MYIICYNNLFVFNTTFMLMEITKVTSFIYPQPFVIVFFICPCFNTRFKNSRLYSYIRHKYLFDQQLFYLPLSTCSIDYCQRCTPGPKWDSLSAWELHDEDRPTTIGGSGWGYVHYVRATEQLNPFFQLTQLLCLQLRKQPKNPFQFPKKLLKITSVL